MLLYFYRDFNIKNHPTGEPTISGGMNMKIKRMISLVLMLLMISTLFIGCSNDKDSGSSSTPTSGSEADGGTVKILMAITGGKDDEEMTKFQEQLSKATGLNVQIEKPASDYTQIMLQKLGSNEKYDLIYLNVTDYVNLIEQEALLDITDRVNASTILKNNIDESEWNDITVDGKIYGGFNKKEVFRVVGLNNSLLKKAGIDYKSIEPTMDGYYEVFKKLKETNENKDFYPLDTIISETWDLQPWMAAAGLKNGVVIDEDGLKYAPYSTDEAAPVWDWFKKLYEDGLLDPASFVDKTKDMRAKMGAASQTVAVTADWIAWIGLHNSNAQKEGISTDDYEIVSLPGLKTPDGSYMLGKGGASLFGVPANAENPDGAIKVLEYFATQEGGELLSIGVEGYDYNVVDGAYELTEIGASHGSDHGAPFPIFKDFKSPLGYSPGVEEGLSYEEYASIDLAIPNEGELKATIGKWAIQIIKGSVSTLDGLASMREELVSLGITEK